MNSKKLLKIFKKNIKYVYRRVNSFELTLDVFYFELRRRMEYEYETIVIKEKKWWMCTPHTQQKQIEKGFKYEINFQNKSYEITEVEYNELVVLSEKYDKKKMKKKMKRLYK